MGREMKKYRIFVATIIVSIFLCACTQPNNTAQITEPTLLQPEVVAYNINELRAFFVPRHLDHLYVDKFIGEDLEKSFLYYDEVNHRFPVEQIQESNTHIRYTRYAVKQGGYYYVFWSYGWPKGLVDPSSRKGPETQEYTCVVFSAYLGDCNTAVTYPSIDFYKIRPGVTTMQDVMTMDPYIEYLSYSDGKYTCSMLDQFTVLQIRYKYQQERDVGSVFEAMTVVDAKIVKIEESVSLVKVALFSNAGQ